MKALAMLPRILFLASCGASFLLTSCAPMPPSGSDTSTKPGSPAFAHALNPPGSGLCRFRRPEYTERQRLMGLHGSVRVTFAVDTLGKIDIAYVDRSSGSPELDNVARDAVAQGICTPYVVNGVAQRVVRSETIRFEPPSPTPHAEIAPPAGMNPSSVAFSIYKTERAQRAADNQIGAAPAPSGNAQAPTAPAPGNLTLQQAIETANLEKLGVDPGSTKAAIIERWRDRMRHDPVLSPLLAQGSNLGMVPTSDPRQRTQFFSDGILRLSPEDRSSLFDLTLKALDRGPPDCGGTKSVPIVISRTLSLATLPDDDVDTVLRLTYSLLKQSALHAPSAQVTAEQRAQGQAALLRSLNEMLKNDPESTRLVAQTVVDPVGVTPEVWCRTVRIYLHAMLAMPQPQRDWVIVASSGDAKSQPAPLQPTVPIVPIVPAGLAGNAAPSLVSFADKVRRRVQPNIIWTGPKLDTATTIQVRCAPNGDVLSAKVLASSGNPSWDEATLRAIQRSNPMPSNADGQTPAIFTVVFRP